MTDLFVIPRLPFLFLVLCGFQTNDPCSVFVYIYVLYTPTKKTKSNRSQNMDYTIYLPQAKLQSHRVIRLFLSGYNSMKTHRYECIEIQNKIVIMSIPYGCCFGTLRMMQVDGRQSKQRAVRIILIDLVQTNNVIQYISMENMFAA